MVQELRVKWGLRAKSSELKLRARKTKRAKGAKS
jgi:hypothetical protein